MAIIDAVYLFTFKNICTRRSGNEGNVRFVLRTHVTSLDINFLNIASAQPSTLKYDMIESNNFSYLLFCSQSFQD